MKIVEFVKIHTNQVIHHITYINKEHRFHLSSIIVFSLELRVKNNHFFKPIILFVIKLSFRLLLLPLSVNFSSKFF